MTNHALPTRLRWRWAKSCAGLLALGLTSCLDDPPTFAPRGQIPPFIIAGRVDPPIGAIYEGAARVAINVPFRSEDVNIPLVARLYSDLSPGASRSFPDQAQDESPGIFEDLGRSVTMDWRGSQTGCHSLTLILTYADNYDASSGLPRDDARAARVVWWLNLADGVSRDALMSDCPGANQDDSSVPGVP